MLCSHCGTIVLFEKDDHVRMTFQTGTKLYYHMECFTLNFVRFEDIRIKEVEKDLSTRHGVLDPQGNAGIQSKGVSDAHTQSSVPAARPSVVGWGNGGS